MSAKRKSEKLLAALAEYIEKCNSEKEAKVDKKEKGPFPNVCGYCRHMGIGIRALERELGENEQLSDRIATVLEDAVINADPSAGTLSHCIKLADGIRGQREEGKLTVVFPHSDGEETAS